nr:MAG TPA: hypothetical protein [Caudoviricetes sp.]
MISITKDEAMALRKKFGDDLAITVMNRYKRGGHKRYCTEESYRVMRVLNKLRAAGRREIYERPQ